MALVGRAVAASSASSRALRHGGIVARKRELDERGKRIGLAARIVRGEAGEEASRRRALRSVHAPRGLAFDGQPLHRRAVSMPLLKHKARSVARAMELSIESVEQDEEGEEGGRRGAEQ